jgi:hypothetical protein
MNGQRQKTGDFSKKSPVNTGPQGALQGSSFSAIPFYFRRF